MKHNSRCTVACLLVLPFFASCVDEGSTGSGSDPASLATTEPEVSGAADDDTEEGAPSNPVSDDDTTEDGMPEPDAVSAEPADEPADDEPSGVSTSDDDSASDDSASDDGSPSDDDSTAGEGSASADDDVTVTEPSPDLVDAGSIVTEPEPAAVDAGQGVAWPDAGGSEGFATDAGVDMNPSSGVQLRAVMTEVSDGTVGIAAEWINGTDDPIYLQGCSTTSGWYLDGGDWIEHGGFVLCFQEGPMVVVGPGETYVDQAGVPPSDRGTNIWRLQGPYGVGCVPAEGLFSETRCESVTELVSENEVSVAQ